jgi:acetylornithine/N-succinyldiaminopimelate aminotransferase
MLPPILPLYERMGMRFTHGKGMYLYTDKEEKYLDFAAGYAANSLGHAHPKMVATLREQAGKVWHLCNRFIIPGLEEFSQKLVDNTFADTVYVSNTGAEAVESAVKFGRRYQNHNNTGKYKCIAIKKSFHGRTLAATSASDEKKIIGYEPAVEGFIHVEFNDIEALRAAITPEVGMVLLEPIQGEGGIRMHSKEYIKELRRICDEKDLILIFDEVQCGAARTGYLYAYEFYDVIPDIVATAKGIGGGFPVAATIMNEKVGATIEPASHGSTFGGNPLAMAVGNVAMDILTDKSFLDQVRKTGEYLDAKLIELAESFPDHIMEVRGIGLMKGLKMHDDYSPYEISDKLANEHVVSIPAGDNVMRITPPLICQAEHCDEFIAAFSKVLKTI